jgi:hypothetical protein
MLSFQKNIFKTRVFLDNEPQVELSKRTDSYPEGTACSETPTITFYIETQNINTITTGDIAYNDELKTTVFNGNDLFYNVKIDSETETFLVKISSLGVVEVIGECIVNLVESASRSEFSIEDPDTGCSSTTTISIGISLQTAGTITTNDVVYLDTYGLAFFDGGNAYYKIQLTSNSSTYVCLINNSGVVNVYSVCI